MEPEIAERFFEKLSFPFDAFAAMSKLFAPGQSVKLSPSIFQDQSRRQSHFIFKRIIEEDLTGEIIHYEDSEGHKGVWVRIPYGKILAREQDLVGK